MAPRPLESPGLARPRPEVTQELSTRIALGKEIMDREIRTGEDIDAFGAAATKWMEYNTQLLRILFTNDRIAREYAGAIPQFVPTRDDRLNFRNAQTKTSRQLLKLESILDRLSLYLEPGEHSALVDEAVVPADRSKVFVVHGHDDGARHAMARFLEKLGLEAIILQEQPDQGMTIIEKFETYANQVGFAVVLLTPDDLGGTASATVQAARARQNVIFELGYFAGKLGRGCACLLRKGDVEIPSDLYGVVYTDMDVADGWKLKLVNELKAAGIKFDPRKMFS